MNFKQISEKMEVWGYKHKYISFVLTSTVSLILITPGILNSIGKTFIKLVAAFLVLGFIAEGEEVFSSVSSAINTLTTSDFILWSISFAVFFWIFADFIKPIYNGLLDKWFKALELFERNGKVYLGEIIPQPDIDSKIDTLEDKLNRIELLISSKRLTSKPLKIEIKRGVRNAKE